MLVRNNCYRNNPYSGIRNNVPNDSSNVHCLEKSDISFCSRKQTLKTIAKYVGIMNLLLLTLMPKDVFVYSNHSKVESQSGWEPNVRILSSLGQEVSGYVVKDGYCVKLAERVSNADVKTIEEANSMLAKTGYKVNVPYTPLSALLPGDAAVRTYLSHKKLFPLETYGPQLGIFNKEEKGKDRFVLAFYDGAGNRFINGTDKFSADIDKFIERMKQIYGLPQENVMKIKLDSKDVFEQGLDSILSRVKQLKDLGNAELLILYSGHGNAKAFNEGEEEVEGAMEGQINKYGITEYQVKDLFRKKLQKIKTLFLIDACHAGAWIADEGKNVLGKLG